MILSTNIPLNAQTFLNNVRRDFHAGLHASDYRSLLIRETRVRYPGLIEGLAHLGHARTQRGEVRILADADHIIPRSLWQILIPLVWNLPGDPPPTPDILSNLFWRTVKCNRGAPTRGEALDHAWIYYIQREARKCAPTPLLARTYIEMFLRSKYDEGLNIDVPHDPGKLDEMDGGCDVSSVIAFIQRSRVAQPRITERDLADLVESRFPHIRIEMDGSIPRIEIG